VKPKRQETSPELDRALKTLLSMPSTIDPTRQGGADMAPRSLAAPEMTLEEAVEYDAKFRWRSLPTRSDRARQALIAEVARLQANEAIWQSEIYSMGRHAAGLEAELARFRAALPDVATAALAWYEAGNRLTAASAKDKLDANRAFSLASVAVRKAIAASGLLPQPERQDETGDEA
jgi:hypothetical protein